MRRASALLAGILMISTAVTWVPARAVELKVLSAEAPRDALEHIAAVFARASGHAVTFSFMTAGQVRSRVAAGEAADVAVASPAFIEDLTKSGKGSGSTNLGRIGLAVAIREGARLPDLSTPEAFSKTLLDARSVSFTNPAAGGTAGIYFAGLLQRLGIAEAVTRKAVYATGGRNAAEKVARGEAELGITFPSEIIPIQGAKVAGMFPSALQSYTTYIATVPVASGNAEAGRALIAAFANPAAREHWIAAGFEPPGAN